MKLAHGATRIVILLVAWMSATGQSQAIEPPADGFERDFKLRLGAFAEGDRELGVGDGDPTTEAFFDGQAVAHWRLGRTGSLFARAQLFAPTGELVLTDEDRPRRSDTYVALRELWVDYRGFTSYPGEVIRLGRQRLRDPDGQWFDRDIEALRWIFDTTLVQGHLGVAERLFTGRSDGSDPTASERDRTYVFGQAGGQWRAGHYLGARAIHAFDHADPQDELLSGRRDPKLSEREFTWLDFYAHNDFYQLARRTGWSYWADASVLAGTREDYRAAQDGMAVTRSEDSVLAWSTDLGLRWRPAALALPWQFGVAYAFASGSDTGNSNHRYEQTGLHSNRSRFTGTRSLLYRYNEAYKAELSNLHVGSAYLSLPLERFDASLVVHRFARHRAGEAVIADGLDLAPEPGRRWLGDGLDLVLAWYFGARVPGLAREDEDLRSSLRLRASGFSPGDAYADDADDQYAVKLELTLWY